MFVNLPVDIADPVEALRRINADSTAAKESGAAADTDKLLRAASPKLLATLMTIPGRMHVFNMVVSNVPVPPVALTMVNRKLVEAFAVQALNPYQAMGFVVFTINGKMRFSVVYDPALIQDA